MHALTIYTSARTLNFVQGLRSRSRKESEFFWVESDS